ncbi:MAG: PQQ-dependent sugar dehydrogenase, partial [Acidobacteriota bacterium]|nr:PQQ-dependent sugar dehydrogenase [Acidobacteriota bacterium]
GNGEGGGGGAGAGGAGDGAGASGGIRPVRVVTIASGLDEPNGVAWRDGALYVAEVSRVVRFDGIDLRLDHPPAPGVVNSSYPSDRHHGWKFIRFGPDGLLYVPVGAPCNICNPRQPIYASITRIRPDGTGLEIFAKGIRNTVGFDWSPDTRELWFTDNGRDRLGDDRPPDELNHAARAGLDFGYPYCHGTDIADPEYGGPDHPCSRSVAPEWNLPAHVAALGMRFYSGTMFPPEYRGQVFIAEHGSWDRSVPIGYRVSLVRFVGGRPVSYQPFVEGWLTNRRGMFHGRPAWGRPVDVQPLPDGSLLISDDQAGAIYRVSYHGPAVAQGDRGDSGDRGNHRAAGVGGGTR